jgi:hypothetical protein
MRAAEKSLVRAKATMKKWWERIGRIAMTFRREIGVGDC